MMPVYQKSIDQNKTPTDLHKSVPLTICENKIGQVYFVFGTPQTDDPENICRKHIFIYI